MENNITTLSNTKINDADKFTEIPSQRGLSFSRPDDIRTENTENYRIIIYKPSVHNIVNRVQNSRIIQA